MMKHKMKGLLGIFLFLFTVNCLAIEIHLQSPEKVSVVGMVVNGKAYGGVGNSYTKVDAPIGTYSFGIRADGVFSKDIGCISNDGKWAFKLAKNTAVKLNYDGKKCNLSF